MGPKLLALEKVSHFISIEAAEVSFNWQHGLDDLCIRTHCHSRNNLRTMVHSPLLRPHITTRNFRISVYIVHAFNLSWGIAFTFAYLFQCRPVERFWTQQQGKRDGCIDIAMHDYYAVAAIITDLVVLVLPWPVVWKSNMRTTQKVAVLSIFGLGAMCISPVTSLIRFVWHKW